MDADTLAAEVNRQQYLIDIMQRYFVLPAAYMVSQPESFAEVSYTWPKLLSGETGPLSFHSQEIAEEDVSLYDYRETDALKGKFCARCLCPGTHTTRLVLLRPILMSRLAGEESWGVDMHQPMAYGMVDHRNRLQQRNASFADQGYRMGQQQQPRMPFTEIDNHDGFAMGSGDGFGQGFASAERTFGGLEVHRPWHRHSVEEATVLATQVK